MQRRLCVAILSLEAILLGLTTLVLLPLGDVSTGAALGIGLGLMAACIVLCGLMRFRWAYALGWVVQLVAIGLGTAISAMYVLGAVFLALWATAFFLGAKIERERAEWEARHGEEHRAAAGRPAAAD